MRLCRVHDNIVEALRSLQGLKNMGGERFSSKNTRFINCQPRKKLSIHRYQSSKQVPSARHCFCQLRKSLIFPIDLRNGLDEDNSLDGNENTDKNQISLIYTEIQNGAVAKSYMRKGFLIYEEMRKYLTIYEEAVSNI